MSFEYKTSYPDERNQSVESKHYIFYWENWWIKIYFLRIKKNISRDLYRKDHQVGLFVVWGRGFSKRFREECERNTCWNYHKLVQPQTFDLIKKEWEV